MHASSARLAAALLLALLVQDLTQANAALIERRGARTPAHRATQADFIRPERMARASDRTELRRHERDRNLSDFGFGDGALLPDDESAGDAAPNAAFAAPTINIQIVTAQAVASEAKAPVGLRAPGPKIITLGPSRPLKRLAPLPLVVYGRAPVGEAD